MKSIAIASLAAGAAAHGQVDARRKNWKLLGRASADASKTFSVAMPMKDFAGLERSLLEVSDPDHPRYGQWLSQEEADHFARTPFHIAKEVRAWAESTGASCKRLPESFKCTGSVAQIERLLSTELSVYGHTQTGKTIIRTSAPATVPDHMTGKVVMVTGLRQFPVARAGSVRPIEVIRALGDVDYSIVPQTLIGMYNVTLDGNAKSTQAPVEFQAYPAFVQTDLDAFAAATTTTDYTIPTANIIGPFSPDPEAESTLDQQYIGAMGQNNQQWYWTESDWQYEFGQDLSTQPADQLPNVLSISYAWYELDQCDISPGVAPCENQPVPAGSAIFVNAVNQLFAKAAARGVTLVAASGDSGAHGRTDPSCSSPTTRADFPSSSPYVTSVGATELQNGQTGPINTPICTTGGLTCATDGYEIVASNKVLAFFSSGGGFSNVAARPTWQDAVVSAYIKNSTAVPAGNFNASGRGAPDVAAVGHNYYIELGGQTSSVDGTSAATPVFAGLVANLNAWRITNGKPVLGFINPLLYKIHAGFKGAFNDVVQGDNTCTEDACPCPANTGFYAAPGWDATTGLGTPNYGMIKAAIEKLGI